MANPQSIKLLMKITCYYDASIFVILAIWDLLAKTRRKKNYIHIWNLFSQILDIILYAVFEYIIGKNSSVGVPLHKSHTDVKQIYWWSHKIQQVSKDNFLVGKMPDVLQTGNLFLDWTGPFQSSIFFWNGIKIYKIGPNVGVLLYPIKGIIGNI